MKKDDELTLLEMLFKYKNDTNKAMELLDNYSIKEIKEYYSENAGNHYCEIIETWSQIHNIPLTTTLSKLYEDLYERTKVFDRDKLKKEFVEVCDSSVRLSEFLCKLKQHRENFLSWYKDNVEMYEYGLPKAFLIKNEVLVTCDGFIKQGLFIKFMNDELTLNDVKKEKDND